MWLVENQCKYITTQLGGLIPTLIQNNYSKLALEPLELFRGEKKHLTPTQSHAEENCE